MKVRFAHVAAIVSLATFAFAEDAPRDVAAVSLKGKKVSIEYGQPALKGRTLDSLIAQLPPERGWRAGVDQVTTLTTETDLLIGGKKVPAGKYTLYVQAPENGDWSLLVNSDQGIPLIKLWDQAPSNLANAPWPHLEKGGYTNIASKEVARATMKPGNVSPAAELFKITLTPANQGATLKLAWGDRSWSLDIQAAQ